MPTNLIIRYNQLLELAYLTPAQRTVSLGGVFRRDFEEKAAELAFRSQRVYPIPGEEDNLKRLFRHLTTVVVDHATGKREYEAERSERLHWVRVHILEQITTPCLVFYAEDPEGERLYIFNEAERYVVVLQPLRKVDAFYLLTAYRLEPRNMKKIKNKYRRRLPDPLP